MKYYNLTDLINEVSILAIKDVYKFNIEPNSKDHLKLLYHYTIKQIIDLKLDNNDIIFVNNLKSSDSSILGKQYDQFISSLPKFIPSIKIIDDNRVHQYLFNNILTNRFQNATKKVKNFSKLAQFGRKYGLTEVIDNYLSMPKYRYILGSE